VLKNVTSDGRTRREMAKKRSLRRVNEHFEPLSNAVMPSAVVFQNPVNQTETFSNYPAALAYPKGIHNENS
jgi:hypothetical protein